MRKTKVAGVLFLLVVLHPLIGSQLTTAVLALIVLWAFVRLKFRVPKRSLFLMIVPVSLIVLGLSGAGQHSLRDVVKDGWYYSFAPLAILAGYLATRSCRKTSSILLAFVAGGLALSFWHLGELVAHRNLLQSGDIGGLRDEIGGGYILSSVAPLILFLSGHYKVPISGLHARTARFILYSVTLTSVAFAFSRTMILSMIISLLAGLGWLTTKNKRGVVIVLGIAGLMFSLSAVVPADPGSFLGKFAQTRDEVSFSDFSSTADVTHYWRAYETLMAIRTYLDGNAVKKSLGFGFGQLVDIGMDVQLGDAVMSRIPIFHNGYVYVLLKTGYVGLALFVCYLMSLYVVGARRVAVADPEMQLLGGMLMAMISTVFVSTFVVSGWFNPTLMCPVFVLIGALLALLGASGGENESVEGRQGA